MLSPNEIAAKRFDKSMSGYRTDEVEAFLAQVAQEYSNLLESQNELEQKIEVLADKLEEYRRDEDSLKSAVFEAQKLGSTLVREAKNKAEQIEQEAVANANAITARANQDAEQILSSAKTECGQLRHEQETAIEEEQAYYDKLRAEVGSFRKRIMQVYREHLELIQQLPEEAAQEVAARGAARTGEAAAEPQPEQTSDEAVSETIPEPVPESAPAVETSPAQDAEEPSAAPEEPVYEPPVVDEQPVSEPAPSYDPSEEPTRELPPIREGRHGVLKFGENYNMREDRERGRRKK